MILSSSMTEATTTTATVSETDATSSESAETRDHPHDDGPGGNPPLIDLTEQDKQDIVAFMKLLD